MTSQITDSPAQDLQRVWMDSLRTVLSQIAGAPITVEAVSEQEAGASQSAKSRPGVWQIFQAAKAMHGQMAIQATEAEAVVLGQLLVSEPHDPAATFEKDRREAFEELLRQVLGQVATGLKTLAEGEVELKPAGGEAPAWPDAARLGIRITGEKIPAFDLVLVATAELLQSLRRTPAEIAPLAKPAEGRAPEPAAGKAPNLDLLLDVKLEATIRFGQKQMLLREILELHPGSALAMDHHVDEPVDLLVGGRMVARGEVVIVDGNYGLRVTEILAPHQRINSLRA